MSNDKLDVLLLIMVFKEAFSFVSMASALWNVNLLLRKGPDLIVLKNEVHEQIGYYLAMAWNLQRQSSLIILAEGKSSEADHPRPHHASLHLCIALFSPLEHSPPSVPPQRSPLFPGPPQAAASS